MSDSRRSHSNHPTPHRSPTLTAGGRGPIQCMVVVPNHNGLAWLPDCLASLRTEWTAGVETLLVDDASTDDSVRYVRREFAEVAVLALPTNLGFVRAVNLGLLVARRRNAGHVLMLNNDTRMCKGSLAVLLKTANASPDFGVIGAVQTDFEGNLSLRTRAILQSGELSSADSLISTDWVEGSCLLVRREVLQRVGYLDSIFAPCDFEEVDFCRRVRAAGWRVGLAPNATIQHRGAGSFSGSARDRRQTTSERNYLLYRASESSSDLATCWWKLASHAARRLGKSIWRGEPSLATLLSAFAATPRLLPALTAKVLRDGAGQACPILGDRISWSPVHRCYADCARWIEQENAPLMESAA